MISDRSLKIDTLRGLACILFVAFHVVGSSPDNGLKVPDGGIRSLNDILAYVRMPLFTFLSGLVYSFYPFQYDVKKFVLKKARRLLVPMLTVGTFFAVLQCLTTGTNGSVDNWFLLHIKPVAHFWFIESLFILFLLTAFLEKFKVLDGFKGWVITLVVSSLIFISPLHSDYFSFSGFIYLTPFFLLGMGVHRYKLLNLLNKNVALILAISITIVFLLIYIGFLPFYEARSIAALLISSASCVCLLAVGFRSKALSKIGMYSYSIYLFHVFFTALSRIILYKFKLDFEIIFIVSLVAGIFGPILVELMLVKFDFSRVLFLGKATIKK